MKIKLILLSLILSGCSLSTAQKQQIASAVGTGFATYEQTGDAEAAGLATTIALIPTPTPAPKK